MNSNLIIGLITTAFCVAIQCMIMATMLRTLYRFKQKGLLRPTILGISSVLIIITLIIFTGNLLQIALWAGVFLLLTSFRNSPLRFITQWSTSRHWGMETW